jgi:hypothetical protein
MEQTIEKKKIGLILIGTTSLLGLIGAYISNYLNNGQLTKLFIGVFGVEAIGVIILGIFAMELIRRG